MKNITALLLFVLLLLSCFACQGQTAAVENDPALETAEAPVTGETPNAAEPAALAVLEKLEVASSPDKTTYSVGEAIDLSGLVINAIYSDGSVQENVDWSCADKTATNRMESVSVECLGKALRIPIQVIYAGNAEPYTLANLETVENSPVKGNVYLWLGSSVTYGAMSDGVSMADFFAKKWDCVSIKEAVSGTTLNASNPNSYVERLNKYLDSADRAGHLDGFICQLSTNDTRNKAGFGLIMPDFITMADGFDVNTTFGAMEYICATVKETWDCPIYFYTNTPFDDSAYEDMVTALEQMASKWNITIIDLYRDEQFNAISEEERALFMGDKIHPTMAGYRNWWLAKFEQALLPSA